MCECVNICKQLSELTFQLQAMSGNDDDDGDDDIFGM